MTNATTNNDFGTDLYGNPANQPHYMSTRTANPDFAYGVQLSGMSHGDRSAPGFIKWIEQRGLGTAVHHPYDVTREEPGQRWTAIDIFAKDYASLKKILDVANGFDFYSEKASELYPNG